MPYPAFAKWPSIQRLSSEICWITEKIDGTNGVIYVPETTDKPVLAGSRERWLTNEDGTPPVKGKDNFGFAEWVNDRVNSLRTLGPGYHYGEFHGAGIQRKYDLTDKRWPALNTGAMTSVFMMYVLSLSYITESQKQESLTQP